MIPRTFRFALVAALVATAGFATAGHLSDPMPEGHDHARAELHRLAQGGLSRVGALDPPKDVLLAAATPGAFDFGLDAAGGAYFGEVDVRGNTAYLAQLKPPAGVHVIDVSVPSSPREVGTWQVASGTGGITDVKVSRDGRFLYAAYQGPLSDPQNGIFVLDVSNPAAPAFASHMPVSGAGVHMIYVHEDALGNEWVLGPTGQGAGMPIALAQDDLFSGLRTLKVVTTLSGTPHDVTVFDDPTLGPLLVVANGGSGVQIHSFLVPAQPVLLGNWAETGADLHYAHTVRATTANGVRYVIVSPEGGALGYGVSQVAKLWILDASIPAQMKVVGSWSNPGGHIAQEFLFSTHNFQLVGDRVYLAHNHGGVWVLDFSAPPAMHALAYYLPSEHTTVSTPGGPLMQRAIPGTWDVVVKEGLIFAADRAGGLYVLHYEGDLVGPGGPTSYG